MQDDGPTNTPSTGRRSAPDAVWDAVRADYLAGTSAPECARRHGVGVRALRKRAARQGWRRMDQPWSPPNRLDAEDEGVALEQDVDGDLDRIDYAQLGYVANCRMMRAVLRGDAVAALRWRRVSQAMEAEQAEIDRMILQDDMLHAQRRAAAPDVHDAHDAHGVFSEPDPG
ncbi:MAG TPA: hypothetical protein VGE54_05295 [Brevundimonas sp.]